jgi:hemerythrin superfamily protein
MVDFPKIERSGRDLADRWSRTGADLSAQGLDIGRRLGCDLAGRGQDVAEALSRRVRDEARSFARQEEEWERGVRGFLASPAAQLAGAAVLGFVVGVAANGARKAAIQGAEAVAGDWMAVLKAEHRAVEGLFEAMLATSARQKTRRAALFAKINYALTKHALQEETVVYPALRETHLDGAAGDLAKHLYSDHADIKIFLHELGAMAKDDPLWIERIRAFHACVSHHVREEEDEVFPRFHDLLSPQQNGKLTLLVHREGLKLA